MYDVMMSVKGHQYNYQNHLCILPMFEGLKYLQLFGQLHKTPSMRNLLPPYTETLRSPQFGVPPLRILETLFLFPSFDPS